MARKRMIDPEYWSDEKIATLSLPARLFFIGLWNFSDDAGIFKSHPHLLKSFVFPYDELETVDIEKYLIEIEKQNLIFRYKINGQQYGIILNFRKHQVINKPQPSKLPAPSIQNRKYQDCIFKRDNYICHLCGDCLEGNIVSRNGEGKMPSIDHIIPQSKNGNDLPANLATACLSCNKSRGNKPLPQDYGSDTVVFQPKRKEVKLIEDKLIEDKITKDQGNVLQPTAAVIDSSYLKAKARELGGKQ